MSNALAVAAVTAVLRDLLDNGMVDQGVSTQVGESVLVSALPPDRVPLGDGEGSNLAPRLNLFLYRVSPNPGWRNAALPSRDGDGNRSSNPPLALDLHYLLTAYANQDLQSEILLGYGMQVLHEVPVLGRDAIRTALGGEAPLTASILPAAVRALVAADLSEQVEMVKLTPNYLSTEEMSKLWAALQTRYRPTVAYQASVVLIESRRRARAALPVRESRLHALPFRRPVIDAVIPQTAEPGASIVIVGTNLKAANAELRFATASVRPAPEAVGDNRIEARLPDDLPAGVQTVQVIHPLDLGTANEPHRGFESNLGAFILTPQFDTPAPFAASRGGDFVLDVRPPVERRQRAELLVGDAAIPARISEAAARQTLRFPIPGDFPTGDFLFRLRVDGAESPLELDPLTRRYLGPQVAIT